MARKFEIYRDTETGGWVLEVLGLCGWQGRTWVNGWYVAGVFGTRKAADRAAAKL